MWSAPAPDPTAIVVARNLAATKTTTATTSTTTTTVAAAAVLTSDNAAADLEKLLDTFASVDLAAAASAAAGGSAGTVYSQLPCDLSAQKQSGEDRAPLSVEFSDTSGETQALPAVNVTINAAQETDTASAPPITVTTALALASPSITAAVIVTPISITTTAATISTAPPTEEEVEEEGNGNEGEIESQASEKADETTNIATQVLTQPQELNQDDRSMDTPEETTVNSQPLTKKLLASGGDIRALLSSDQPLSSLRAQTTTIGNGKEGAGQKIVKNDEEEAEEEEQQERFVRPRRLRRKESKKAASDGFPSAIALSHRWHPDHMQDLPGDAANLSIRSAFDTKFDEYYVFRHWRPSQGR